VRDDRSRRAEILERLAHAVALSPGRLELVTQAPTESTRRVDVACRPSSEVMLRSSVGSIFALRYSHDD
jgi:hypothetical protein